jgi:hypothetical protein
MHPSSPADPFSSKRRKRQQGQALMLMSVGIVFLVGTLGVLADASYGYYLKNVAPPSSRSVTTSLDACTTSGICKVAYTEGQAPAPSDRGIFTRHWDSLSQRMSSLAMLIRVGSFSAVWLAAVATASLCMFCTRP